MERWRGLANRALVRAERRESSARHLYRDAEGVEAELNDLVRLEAECCPFLAFEVGREGGELVLEISGPDEAAPMLDLFAGAEMNFATASSPQS